MPASIQQTACIPGAVTTRVLTAARTADRQSACCGLEQAH